MSDAGREELGILLEILKDPADQKISVKSCNTGMLLRLAGIHRVNYQLLVYAQNHPGYFSAEQMDALGTVCRKNAKRSLSQLGELIRLAKGFHEAGITIVVIKGPQLARMIYGREALKESVDLDIMLVRESDLEVADVLLKIMGYTWSTLDSHTGKISRKIFHIAKREVQYVNPGKNSFIDLHIRAGSNTYLTVKRFRNIFDQLETFDLEGCAVNILPAEQYLVYLCYHGSLHEFSRLSWLMDIRAYLSLKKDVLDFDRVLYLAREINAEKSVYMALALLNSYFGDKIPAKIYNAIPHNKSFGFLLKSCERKLTKDPGYGLTLRGRTSKFIYMMLLINGFPGRIDYLFGIFMRMLDRVPNSFRVRNS